MNDSLLHFIANFGLASGLIALSLALYNTWQIRKLNALRTLFFSGNKAADLEDTIHELFSKVSQLQDQHLIEHHALSNLQKDFLSAVQKVGVVRFNPFDDGGGNFSFSLALLDANLNGVVITSIHGRQQNRIYTKKINAGKSEIQLIEEEQKAIQEASFKN